MTAVIGMIFAESIESDRGRTRPFRLSSYTPREPCSERYLSDIRTLLLDRVTAMIGHTLNIVLIALMTLLVVGTLPTWPYSRTWDYYPCSVLGLLLVLILMLVLLERI
jgi:hypothetical protein